LTTPSAPDEREATLAAAVSLFDAGRYLAAHELFEELWEATQGADADFYKGLLQASVALHHRETGNPEGALRLHASMRGLLARYLPRHHGIDVAGFLGAMQALIRDDGARAAGERPRLARETTPGDTAGP
jgi:hypothetical protein